MDGTARAESDALHRRVRRFIEDGDGDFDAIACDLARYQQRIPAVRRLYRARGVDPASLTRAEELVALPTDAFRLRRIAVHPPGDDVRVFATSGTTDAARGRHPLRTTATYEAAAMAWGRRMLLDGWSVAPFVGLVSDEATAPASSLTFMLARFAEALGGDASFHWDGERLDREGIARRIGEARGPLLLAGTSFAFVHWLDGGAERLPEGSRVMQTGGFKGRSREVAPDVLRRSIAEATGVPLAAVVAEYGMTELGSQLYQAGIASGTEAPTYRAPPWLRVTAVDPESLAPVDGVGIARFVDLANVDGATAVLTADRVRVRGDEVELLGRLPGATPRGCSLALEPLLEGP